MSYGTDAPAYWDPSLAGDKSSTLEQEQCVQAVGQRPLIELEPTDHPLAAEQRAGITLARVQEIAETLLHGLPAPRSRPSARYRAVPEPRTQTPALCVPALPAPTSRVIT